jgi:hypothetical protein
MTGTETNNAGSPHSIAPKTSEEIASTLRLRPERPPVTRLSRKALASGTAVTLLLVSAAVLWALQNNRTRGPASEELYSTDHQNVADGLAGCRATTRVFRATCLASDHHCPAIWAVPSLRLKLNQDRLRSMPSSSE